MRTYQSQLAVCPLTTIPEAHLVAGRKQLGQDPIQELKLPADSYNLLIHRSSRREIVVHLGEYERVITDLSKLHQGVLKVILSLPPVLVSLANLLTGTPQLTRRTYRSEASCTS